MPQSGLIIIIFSCGLRKCGVQGTGLDPIPNPDPVWLASTPIFNSYSVTAALDYEEHSDDEIWALCRHMQLSEGLIGHGDMVPRPHPGHFPIKLPPSTTLASSCPNLNLPVPPTKIPKTPDRHVHGPVWPVMPVPSLDPAGSNLTSRPYPQRVGNRGLKLSASDRIVIAVIRSLLSSVDLLLLSNRS